LNLQYISDMLAAMHLWEENNISLLERILERYRQGTGREHLRRWERYHLFRLWQSNREKCVHSFSAPPYLPGQPLTGFYHMRIASSPKGDVIALDERDGSIRIRDAHTLEERGSIHQAGEWASIAFSLTGNELLIADPDANSLTIHDWRQMTSREIALPARGGEKMSTLALDPARTLLALGYDEGVIQLFDWTTCSVVHDFPAIDRNASAVSALDFSPNGEWLASGNEDSPRRVARWRVSDDTLTELEPFEACFDIGCLEVSSKSVWAIGERQGSRICL
jgi:WD40 repeat protein